MADLHNPYAPPAAAVADIAPGDGPAFQPVRLFGAKGRIGRLRYLAYMFGANFILGIGMWVILIILGVVVGIAFAANGALRQGGAPPPEAVGAIAAVGIAVWVIWAVTMALMLTFHIMLGIRRSHDMNLSGWAVLLTLIPLVGLIWMLVPGTRGANRFGAPPPPNSSGVKVVFGIGIFFMIAGLLLAIAVAAFMPSLKDFAERAQEQQRQLQDQSDDSD